VSGTLEIEWGNLDRMFEAMRLVDQQSVEIDGYFTGHVCSDAGFDYDACVLRPIGDQLEKVAGYFTDLREVFQGRWDGVMESIIASARHVDGVDGTIDYDFSRYLGGMGPYAPQSFPSLPDVDVELFEMNDVTELLEAPGDGEKTMPHNKEWESVTETYDGLRDTINEGIDKINSLGVVSVERISEKSLDEWIVYPLSGNYLAIQGNATACDTTHTAMSSWGNNFSLLSGKVVMALKGEVEASLVLHLNVYNIVMQAVGACINAGSVVFDSIARVSERIAVSVENALVTMAKVLLRVSKKIASRVLGWVGWALLVADIIEKGTAAITDIIDDVRLCIDIISSCFELVDAISAWAEESAERLDAFKELLTLVEQLPKVAGGDLSDLPPIDTTQLETTLDGIGIDFGDAGDAEESLDEELENLEEEYPESLGDDPDEGGDDDDIILAPGPLDGSPYGGDTGTTV
jgi:hypothetical protein